MNSRTELLKLIDKSKTGLEIGPGLNPIAPKREGYNVEILDFLPSHLLYEKYKISGPNQFEDVDYIWNGEKYQELIGEKKFDWIIASHVLEHTPDLISFLRECRSILKDSGILCLIVPDKRYCFDTFREVTGIGKIIDNYFDKRKSPSLGSAIEQTLNSATKNGKIAWNSSTRGKPKLSNSMEKAVGRLNADHSDVSNLEDVHSWCFVPHSLRLLIEDLYHLELIPFRESAFASTVECEFLICLTLDGDGPDLSRLTLLEMVDSESSKTVVPPRTLRGSLRNLYSTIRS